MCYPLTRRVTGLAAGARVRHRRWGWQGVVSVVWEASEGGWWWVIWEHGISQRGMSQALSADLELC